MANAMASLAMATAGDAGIDNAITTSGSNAGRLFPLPRIDTPINHRITRSARARRRFVDGVHITRTANSCIDSLNVLSTSYFSVSRRIKKPIGSRDYTRGHGTRHTAKDLLYQFGIAGSSSLFQTLTGTATCSERAATAAGQRRLHVSIKGAAQRYYHRVTHGSNTMGASDELVDLPDADHTALLKRIQGMGKDSVALSTLLGYADKGATARTIVASRMSLPLSAGEVDLLQALPPNVAKCYASEEAAAEALLLPAADLMRSRVRPRPFAQHSEYIALLRRMNGAGMLSFTTDPKIVNGLFAVEKPDGSQRLIIDARPTNNVCHEPLHVELPTPDLFSRLQVPKGKKLYVAKSDLSDYFYRFRIPQWMEKYFALPAIDPIELGLEQRYGDVRIYPCLTVLAMGWSHSVYLVLCVNAPLLSLLQSIAREEFRMQNATMNNRAISRCIEPVIALQSTKCTA